MNPVSIVVILVALVVPNIHLPSWGAKHPPTAELIAAQQSVVEANAREEAALKLLNDAKAAQQAKTDAQLDYTQEMAFGVETAIHQIPLNQQSVEIKLAAEFSARTMAGFEAARGKLSPAQNAEIKKLFDNALAAKTAEVAVLRASLAQKDSDLQVATSEKKEIAAKIPVLAANLQTEVAAHQATVAKADTLEKSVIAYAQKADAKETENGSLRALVERIAWSAAVILAVLAFLYYVAHFAIPNIAQGNPTVAWLQTLNNNVKSAVSSHL